MRVRTWEVKASFEVLYSGLEMVSCEIGVASCLNS